MQTMVVAFAIGQRFGQRVLGAAERMWSITAIEPPATRFAPDRIVLTAEGNGATMYRVGPVLSQELMDGDMRWDGELTSSLASRADNASDVALSEIVAMMSRVQLRKFKTRSAYVSVMLQAQSAGLSWKSAGFCELVARTFAQRQAAWAEKVRANPTDPPEPIEATAPSSFSVDRWFRAVRRHNGDLRVLAIEALAIQTRAYRRPEEHKLLAAFLVSKAAKRANYTASALTREFGRLVKRTDPLRLDDAIEELTDKAKRIALENKERTKKRPLKRRKYRSSPEPRSVPTAE